MGKRTLDLYITANSPGEIAGWVTPVVREVRARDRNCRITVVILPCQYASGAEVHYGAEVEGVDRCLRVGQLSALANEPDGVDRSVPRLAFHLGGDLFFSVMLSRRLGAKLWAYTSRPRWARFVERFFVPDVGAADRFRILDFPMDRYTRVGHLALDSVVLRETESVSRVRLGLDQHEQAIAFLSGSRPIEYCDGVPLFVRVASGLLDRFPDHRAFFPLAPTVEEEKLQDALAKAGIMWRGSSRVRELDLGAGRIGTVVRDYTLETLNCCRFAVAVPGTNNLQAAALYVPYLMVLPLDRADEYPLDGIAGLLPLWVPGMRKLKRSLIERLNERTEFVSLPNKMARRMIAPEIRGYFTPEDVVEKAAAMLESPSQLKEISREFWELTHERGAAARIAEDICAYARPDSECGIRRYMQ